MDIFGLKKIISKEPIHMNVKLLSLLSGCAMQEETYLQAKISELLENFEPMPLRSILVVVKGSRVNDCMAIVIEIIWLTLL